MLQTAWPTSCRAILAAIVLLLPLQIAAASTAPPLSELLGLFGIDAAKEQKLRAGEILTNKGTEFSDKELALGAVMFLPVPPEALKAYVRDGKWFSHSGGIQAFGLIAPDSEPQAFGKLGYSSKEADEAKALLAAESGDAFNLSAAEFARLAEFRAGGAPPSTDAANTLAREFLAKRLAEFARGGTKAIAPYVRADGGSANPGEELELAVRKSTALQRLFPDFYRALTTYPPTPPGIGENFFWLKQDVEGRPAFILLHRLAQALGDGAIMAERQFYAGHDYNSMLVLAGVFPTEGGSFFFYVNRTSTDQVAGFPLTVRHDVGRKRMEKEVVAEFARIRAEVKGR